jgi:hypothetical protein
MRSIVHPLACCGVEEANKGRYFGVGELAGGEDAATIAGAFMQKLTFLMGVSPVYELELIHGAFFVNTMAILHLCFLTVGENISYFSVEFMST